MRIGVFDSGIGGITVLAELKTRFTNAQFVYLGDTANVPYGNKSPTKIKQLCKASAEILKMHNLDVVVVACNTASSTSLDVMQEVLGSVPVVGVIGAGVNAVIESIESTNLETNGSVLILATRATVQSKAYTKLLRKRIDEHPKLGTAGIRIIQQACPLLVPMIEEGWVSHPILNRTIEEYLNPHARLSAKGCALLGCTHYPWIQDAIQKALPGWTVLNSAVAVAKLVDRRASRINGNSRMVNERRLGDSDHIGLNNCEWIFTDPEAVPSFIIDLIKRESRQAS